MSREIASRVLCILAGVFCIIAFIIGIVVYGIRSFVILMVIFLAIILYGAFGGEMTPEDQALVWTLIVLWVIIPIASMVFWLVIGILILVWQGDTYSRRVAIIVLGALSLVFGILIGAVIFIDPFFAQLSGFWLASLSSMLLAIIAGILAIIGGAIAEPRGGV